MSATSLASEVANSALDTIAKALPKSLADRVPIGLVQQVFVWVVQNETDAKELVTILQDNGFENIKLDGKGTTITAQSGGEPNATTDSTSSCTRASKETESCSGMSYTQDSCPDYYITDGSSTINCRWSYGQCEDAGCTA